MSREIPGALRPLIAALGYTAIPSPAQTHPLVVQQCHRQLYGSCVRESSLPERLHARHLMTSILCHRRPKRTIVVVDWGGGGIEATVVRRTDGVLSVAGRAADASVGGGEFTNRMVAFCARDFKRRTGGDIYESRRSMLKVKRLSALRFFAFCVRSFLTWIPRVSDITPLVVPLLLRSCGRWANDSSW